MTPKNTQDTPSRNEDEYFARKDAELMKEMRAKLDKEREQTERKAHYMKCPKDGADLKEKEHDQVKVDVCPECGGMWLDAGELDIVRHAQKSGKPNIFHGILDIFPSKSASRK